MGGILTGGAAEPAPDFFVQAMRDPRSGRLQRARIVKGWLDGGGEARERVFDVACSDDLAPDPARAIAAPTTARASTSPTAR